jgi:Flp pilus assembly protein TadD
MQCNATKLTCARRALACFAALIVVSGGGSAWAQTGRVGGLVRDERGQPIKGATVIAENESIGQSFTATTDEKGRFNMLGLRAGTWRFVAQAPGFSPEAGLGNIRTGRPNAPITFGLKKTGNANFGALGGIPARDLQSDLAAADALFNQQKWDESIAAYRAIVARAPALSVVDLQIAAAYRNKKDFAAAIAAYNDLLKIDPTNEKAQVGVGAANMERGDLVAAERALESAAASPAAGREVLYTLGDVMLARGDAAEAARWYRKAADADPTWGKPLYKLGLYALNNGQPAEAEKLMDQVLAVDPVSPEAALAKATLDTLNK